MIYLNVIDARVVCSSRRQPADLTGWIAYDGDLPVVGDRQHLEYRDGAVVLVDDRRTEVAALRAEAYARRVDPITCEILRLTAMGGSPERIADAESRRLAAVNQIETEYPYHA